MAFKKVLTSDGRPIVIGSTKLDNTKFPPGFSYRIGSMIYTVKKDVTQESSSSMREVGLSDGTTEIMPVESIVKDLKEHDCEILPMDEKFIIKEVVIEEPVKIAKKKITKKKIVKKKKKSNG